MLTDRMYNFHFSKFYGFYVQLNERRSRTNDMHPSIREILNFYALQMFTVCRMPSASDFLKICHLFSVTRNSEKSVGQTIENMLSSNKNVTDWHWVMPNMKAFGLRKHNDNKFYVRICIQYSIHTHYIYIKCVLNRHLNAYIVYILIKPFTNTVIVWIWHILYI